MDIEEDIKILEKFKNNEMQRDKLERDSRCGGWKIGDIYKKLELNIAIEHILAEREEDKKAIDKLKEENYIYMLNGNVVELEMYIKNNYIPKQKVVDKMEQLNKEIKNGDEIEAIFKIKQQQILQELLEDK